MANVLVLSENSLDTLGEKLIPVFGPQLNITDDFWIIKELKESIGSEPGYIHFEIPCRKGVRDMRAYDVALNPDGPIGQIKHGTPVKAMRRYKTVDGEVLTANIQGYRVTELYPRADPGRLEGVAKDCRYDLYDVSVNGKYIWDGVRVVFQEGWFPHVNIGGRPTFVFTPNGTPVFAPCADFGIGTNEAPANPSDLLTTKACYGTLALLMQYLRAFYAYETPNDSYVVMARNEAKARWPEVKFFPEHIQWPEGFGSELDLVSETNFDSALGQSYSLQGGARKGRDLNLSGMAFVGQGGQAGVFDTIFDAAGGWSYKVETSFFDTRTFRNTLVAVPSRYRSESEAVDLPYAFRGQAEDVFKFPTIMLPEFRENSEMTRTKFIGKGNHVMIERRCSSRAEDHGGGTRTAQERTGDGVPALLPAWSLDDERNLRALAVVGGAVDADSFKYAAAHYWWVLTTWVVNPDFDFQEGTVYEGYRRARITRPVKPTLLSFVGNATLANDIQHYPIRSELYDDSKSSPDWALGIENDGLTVEDSGVIYLPSLRDVAISNGGVENLNGLDRGSWRSRTGAKWPVADGMLDLEVNDLRMTLAIPCDHRLVRSLNLLPGADDSGRGAVDDTQGIDSDKFEAGFSRNMVLELNGLYSSWLRINSFPVPEKAGGLSTDFPDLVDDSAPDTALRSDVLMLMAHLKKTAAEHGRIICDGELISEGRFVEGWKVGTQVRNLVPVGTTAGREPFPMRRVIAGKIYTSERTKDESGNETFKNSTRIIPQ